LRLLEFRRRNYQQHSNPILKRSQHVLLRNVPPVSVGAQKSAAPARNPFQFLRDVAGSTRGRFSVMPTAGDVCHCGNQVVFHHALDDVPVALVNLQQLSADFAFNLIDVRIWRVSATSKSSFRANE